MMNSMAHPDAVRNLVQFGDPNIYMRWTAAGLDPAFYTALLTQLSDPGKLMRWAMVPVDPKLWNLLLSTFNPNTYIRWGMSPMDPRAWNLAGNVANPALYTGMAGAIVNPNSYGQGTSSWLTWTPQAPVQGAGSFAMWDPVAMLGNLSGFIPGVNLSALPTLPNIGLPTFSTQGSTLAAPAPQAAAPAAEPPKAEVKPAAEAPKPETKAASATAPTPAAVAPKTEAKPVAAPAAPAKVETKPAPSAPTPAAAPAKAPETKVEVKPAPAAPAAAPAANKVILAGDALFVSGKSGIKDLSKEGKARLDEVVAKLKGVGDIEQIKVVGHADPTGKAEANRKLSEGRAKSVKSYLVAKGVKPAVIVSSGMGDTQPVVQCDQSLAKDKLKECHAPNRRVEIEIVAKSK
jgi:OOP family OmpA-OmpF porin